MDFLGVVETGMYEDIETALKNGADPNIIDDDENLSPLLIASKQCRIDIIKLLLNYGGKINNSGYGPLFSIVYHKDTFILNELINLGADPDVRDECGYTPLHILLECWGPETDLTDLIEYLTPLTHTIDLPNRYGTSLIHDASCCGDKVFDFIFKHTKLFNCQDSEGRTPLMCAVVYGTDHIVRTLAKVSDVFICDNDEKNVYDYCYKKYHGNDRESRLTFIWSFFD